MTDNPDPMNRRAFLRDAAGRVGGMAMLRLLGASGLLASAAGAGVSVGGGLGDNPLAPRPPQFPAKAKRVIYLFMTGGPSHMDTFDYKPELQKHNGKTIKHERRRGVSVEGVLLGSARKWKRYGETEQWCSDAFRYIPQHMDKLAVVKSLYSDSFAHGSALLEMNTGQFLLGHPAMGAWMGYGLGTENPDLPGFVVMQDPRGGPINGPSNWSCGYMPAAYQGTLFRSTGDALLHMSPSPDSGRVDMTRDMQRLQIQAINELNARHATDRAHYSELAARDRNYNLAYRMQETAPEALDLDQEDERTKEMYGLNDPAGDHRLALAPGVFGRQCLIARRMIERGVRFVQIFHGGGHQQMTWDAHHGQEENIAIHCPEVDRPIAGLLTDLEQRGLLDETLVIWGGEFGRQPVSQLAGDGQTAAKAGRDHNPKGFTMWMAGAGIRPGPYGETDEHGFEAVVDRHHVRDMHATILHLMGLDVTQLTYPYGGLDRKLTGVIPPRLLHGILA
jgi:hypothetical protein